MNFSSLQKICDIAKELQTDELKLKVYRQLEKFVYKNYKHYYPHFEGELHDLVLDIFEEFVRPKRHRNGEVFSELDRVDFSKVGSGDWKDTDKALATYTQRYAINRLIDKERTHKEEIHVSEKYNSEEGGLTIDRIVNGKNIDTIDELETSFYDLMDDPDAVKEARRALKEDPEKAARIQYLFKRYKTKLSSDVLEFIESILPSEFKPTENKESLPSVKGAVVEKVKLRGKEGIRISFESKDKFLSKDSPELEDAINELAKQGYSYCTSKGLKQYFIKN